jgi:hypothetical protein
MTDFRKRILKALGRLVLLLVPPLIGKPYTEKLSFTTVTEKRRTEKREKTKKRT